MSKDAPTAERNGHATRLPDRDDALPHNSVAEQTVLGELLLSSVNGDAKCPATAFAELTAADFTYPDFGIVFNTMKAMHAEGVALEPKLVNARLRGRVDNAGAIIYEATINAVTTATVGYYCALVKEASRQRQLRLAANEASDFRRQTSAEAVAKLRASLDALSPAPNAASTVETFDAWAASVENRERPKLFEHAAYGSKLREVQIGEGLVTLFGAPPGSGKTALTSQIVLDALQHPEQQELRALLVNVEMGPHALLNRWAANLTGIGHQWILHRDYDPDATDRLKAGIEELRAIMPRIEFAAPPFTLERIADRAAAFGAGIVVLDYAQRLDSEQRSSDMRAQANVVMDFARRIADQGRAVIVVSAVNRAGYSKENAGLASFRESSEMEYGCDQGWLLIADEQDRSKVTLKCVKNRHGQLTEIPLLFDGARQHFTDDRSGQEWTG